MAYENPWGGGGTAAGKPDRLGGPAPTLSKKISQKFGRTKEVASAGFQKTKVVAAVGLEKTKVAAKKVKRGTAVGVNWIKLKNLGMDYIDLYLIHWSLSAGPGTELAGGLFPIIEFESVGAAVEECRIIGLANVIGVSNFTCNKLQPVLANAKIHRCCQSREVCICRKKRIGNKDFRLFDLKGRDKCVMAAKEADRILRGQCIAPIMLWSLKCCGKYLRPKGKPWLRLDSHPQPVLSTVMFSWSQSEQMWQIVFASANKASRIQSGGSALQGTNPAVLAKI
ncbi:UNVERIFIED_CONTAM: NADPH-dependent codeinone reductase 1-2 [Sesamum calycinum]|uniref:NADPH-dependent codeinone reductase 1-2 n=1 Tax=Sesamum calycinum TaxID=2727403 RepID=A0AAW2QK64_9LAMI